MLYTDGLNTLFAFGGIYAATLFDMNFKEIILFGIALNVSAGIGSIIFAFFDDQYGPKKIIKICLLSLIFICSLILLSNSKILFWILGIGIGLFIGGLQSTSRSCMARLSKKNDQSRMFGIYGLSGKITAFLGPYFVALLTTMFNNQKAGFVSIIIFFILGYLIIRNLKLPNYSKFK
jgi:UMF1 family MFS transporter